MRIAVIDREKCQPRKCNFLCASVCPVNKSGSEPAIEIGEYPKIKEPLCIGCGICIKKCPFSAIKIVNVPEEIGVPVHQYGENGFRLYGLPCPRDGKVIGIIGPNGTGKTTCLKILSGQITPNFGENAQKEDVIKFFRGNELQGYFERLYSGKVKCVIKPQNVEAIPKVFKGNVRALLSRYGDPDKMAKTFGLEKILERNVSVLSGGELQMVALAIALESDANVLFIDEPSSYLDVKQRMKAAELIRNASKSKSTLLVEHDLAVLDYTADGIYIVYGVPSAYGAFSGFKGVLEGINQYLDGYLKEENIRFREYELYFDARAPKSDKNNIIYSYGALKKEREGFKMTADPGEIAEGEVIGIMGPNGIGKTTFINLLAEEIDVEVSYKPQYIELPSVPVRNLLKDVDMERFREVDRKLMVSSLLDKNASSLSGGEKQRVAIAITLSRNADIYLLDEPSAFLDVEQRIECANIIKKMVSGKNKACFVVDHDLLFIDYVSDRFIVFGGTPGREGHATSPLTKKEGMNIFLKEMGITFRRDPATGRPRVNKKGSQKDIEQKRKGNYYYM